MPRLAIGTPARRSTLALFVAALLVVTDVGLAHGQHANARRDGWIVGPLLGLPGIGSDYERALFTLGVGVTRLVPNRPGLDFAVGTMPRVIAEGLFPIGLRIGPSIPVALGPDAFLIPSAGLSGIVAAGSAGATGVGGVYGGLATVVARGRVGLRAGVTWHRPIDGDLSVWLVEIGVMRVPRPRRTR